MRHAGSEGHASCPDHFNCTYHSFTVWPLNMYSDCAIYSVEPAAVEMGLEGNSITEHVLSVNKALSSSLMKLKKLLAVRLILPSHCATAAEFRGAQLGLSYSSCLLVQPGNTEHSQEFWYHSYPSQTATPGAEGRSLLPAMLNVISSPAGKILFRRSHIRDVAVKRLIPIDEYCKVS